MIKLVAFDWNGTLLADTRACWEANNHVITSLGNKPVSLAFYLETNRVPVLEYYQAVGFSKNFLIKNSHKIADLFHKFYETRAAKLRTRQHTKSTLQWLAKENIPLVIFSNHSNWHRKSTKKTRAAKIF